MKLTCILSFYITEDLVLAEERTSERDKKRIMEGMYSYFKVFCAKLKAFSLLLFKTARRKAAEGKRKRKTEEEEIASKMDDLNI